jgi:hypothetical protein
MRAGKRKNHGQTQARMAPEGRPHAGATVTMPAPRAEAAAAAGIEAAVVDRPPELTRKMPLGLCPPPLIVPQQVRPLDEQWAQWILDKSLARWSPESMLATIAEAGIDPAQAGALIRNLPQNPMYHAAVKMRDRYERFARAMHAVQSVRESAPDYTHVEKRSRVSREEFLERYVRGCRPVVLTDMARGWPAMKNWSFAEFKRRYGSMTVQVQAGRESDADFEVNKVKHRRDTNFAAFLDRVSTSGVTNDEYLTANNELLRRPEFMNLLDEVGALPDICDQSMLKRAASLWIGPAGTRTPLHHDTLMLLHTQIVGRKRWRFVSPLSGPHLYNEIDVYSPVDFEALDLQRFPDAAKVKVLDVVVEPGETMFLPLAWWHQVTSLDKCISLSFTNMAFPNTFDFGHINAMK